MTQVDLAPDDWLRAAFLHERQPDDEPFDAERRAQGERWRAQWLRQSKADEQAFAQRLAELGLDDDGLRRLLTHSGAARPAADEWREFVASLARITRDDARHVELPELGRLPTGARGIPFVGLLRPFVADGLARLRAGCASARSVR